MGAIDLNKEDIGLDELLYILAYHGPDSTALLNYWRQRAARAERRANLRLWVSILIFATGFLLGWVVN